MKKYLFLRRTLNNYDLMKNYRDNASSVNVFINVLKAGFNDKLLDIQLFHMWTNGSHVPSRARLFGWQFW